MEFNPGRNRVFVLRIKPGMQDRVPEALATGRLIVGWQEVEGALDQALTKDGLRDLIEKTYSRTRREAAAQRVSLWNYLREMRKGDVALVPHERKHIYVAQVVGDPVRDPTPLTGGFMRKVNWLNKGEPVNGSDIPLVFERMKEQATCYELDRRAYPFIGEFVSGVLRESELAEDLHEIDANTDPTTRSAMRAARVGQGEFRWRLLSKWGDACAVTGSRVLSTVRASHVKPWRASTPTERLDPDNGLPLLATLDALFDAELISFDDDGRMLVSARLPAGDPALIGLPASLRKRPSARLAEYLAYHRARFEEKSSADAWRGDAAPE